MAEWIFRREQGCCAWLGRGPGKRSERRSRPNAICPNAMRSFWKVAAFRLTESIRILSGRRALRCFQNELHHFIILNRKWYNSSASVSLGAILKQSERLSLALSSSYVQRLPSDIELFAFGPHAAIPSFKIGGRDLANEESLFLDIGVRKTAGFLTGRIGGFLTAFENYIYLRKLGEDEFHDRFGKDVDTGGFEPFEYIEREAQFHGFEVEGRFHFLHTEERHLHLNLMCAYVRATNRTDISDLPRIPPFRVGARLEFETPKVLGGLEIRHVAEQDRIAHEETHTDGYHLINADFRYRFSMGDRSVDLFIRGANLTDQEARVHTSFIKDWAPLPGRDVTVRF